MPVTVRSHLNANAKTGDAKVSCVCLNTQRVRNIAKFKVHGSVHRTYILIYRVTQKKGNFSKTQQKFEEIPPKKKILTEIEPLHLPF